MSCVCCHSLWIVLIHDVAEGREIIVPQLAVYAVVHSDEVNIVVWKIGVTIMDKTTKTRSGVADNKTKSHRWILHSYGNIVDKEET